MISSGVFITKAQTPCTARMIPQPRRGRSTRGTARLSRSRSRTGSAGWGRTPRRGARTTETPRDPQRLPLPRRHLTKLIHRSLLPRAFARSPPARARIASISSRCSVRASRRPSRESSAKRSRREPIATRSSPSSARAVSDAHRCFSHWRAPHRHDRAWVHPWRHPVSRVFIFVLVEVRE
jgi:hypothetical protein